MRKKRKLSFRDTFSDQMEKIQKIEDESMAGEPLSPIKEEKETLPDINAKLPNAEPEIKVDESKTNMAEEVSKMIVCPTIQIEEIMVLESSRSDEIDDRDDTKFWKHNLLLTEEDKNGIINNKKISSRHINAVNILLKREIGNKINGLQLSELVPVKLQHENRWVMKFPMDPVSSPACQVHHTHHDHWVSTIFHRGNIYLLDSLGSERKDDVIIPDGLKIQISQIYGREKDEILIKIPEVMKQNNSIDCGLYAIAFVTSYCFRQKLCFELISDSNKLRSHLLECFENNRISEFPLTSKTISTREKKKDKTIKLQNYCLCNLPGCFDDMVQCDKCKTWYHKFCVNAPFNISMANIEYFCDTGK